jgi:hypothetical protein
MNIEWEIQRWLGHGLCPLQNHSGGVSWEHEYPKSVYQVVTHTALYKETCKNCGSSPEGGNFLLEWSGWF